jgi:hypothetical protein
VGSAARQYVHIQGESFHATLCSRFVCWEDFPDNVNKDMELLTLVPVKTVCTLQSSDNAAGLQKRPDLATAIVPDKGMPLAMKTPYRAQP